ncbi:LLM class flavin-dependent oxidoreductase [Microbispora sp. CA-135349]|uniref:LLM class flavin-dependent oxidoreductase n=1 Tax=Microbispora sp. CA-135349 TaxID=3239953 RepID=UPI003D8BFDF3
MHLVLSLMTPGHFRHAWRLPHADPLAHLDIGHFRRLARAAEGTRRFQSLDHVTNGRAAVNIVTTGTPRAAATFGLAEHPGKAARYRRAHEFLEVVTRLWDGWEPDAIVADKESGRYADPSRIHRIGHEGEAT